MSAGGIVQYKYSTVQYKYSTVRYCSLYYGRLHESKTKKKSRRLASLVCLNGTDFGYSYKNETSKLTVWGTQFLGYTRPADGERTTQEVPRYTWLDGLLTRVEEEIPWRPNCSMAVLSEHKTRRKMYMKVEVQLQGQLANQRSGFFGVFLSLFPLKYRNFMLAIVNIRDRINAS